MNVFISGDIANALHSKSIKNAGGNITGQTTEITAEGKFPFILTESFATLAKEPAVFSLTSALDYAAEIEKDEFSSEVHETDEEIVELLHMELSLLNTLKEEDVPDEYFALLEELVGMLTFFPVSTKAEKTENAPERALQLSERIVVFAKQLLDDRQDKREGQQPQLKKADLTKLITLIETKLEKRVLITDKRKPMSDPPIYKAFLFSQPVKEGIASMPLYMPQLQQPKQSIIQWVADTTSEKAARVQLVQKLEGIFAKSHSRIVNGKQSVTIRLNPEHLGTLHIKLQETQQGIAAKLIVHSKTAATLLENGINGLKKNLLLTNTQIDKIEVIFQEQEQRPLHQNKDSEEHPLKHPYKNNREKDENEQSFDELLLEEMESNEMAGE